MRETPVGQTWIFMGAEGNWVCKGAWAVSDLLRAGSAMGSAQAAQGLIQPDLGMHQGWRLQWAGAAPLILWGKVFLYFQYKLLVSASAPACHHPAVHPWEGTASVSPQAGGQLLGHLKATHSPAWGAPVPQPFLQNPPKCCPSWHLYCDFDQSPVLPWGWGGGDGMQWSRFNLTSAECQRSLEHLPPLLFLPFPAPHLSFQISLHLD